MKGIRLFYAAVSMAVLSLAFSACKDPVKPQPGTVPAVGVTAGTAGKSTLSFTVSSGNALHCAWACVELGEEIPGAEEILSKIENAVSVTEATLVEVSGLKPETEYVIIAAASDDKTSVLSEQITMTTLEENVIVLDNAFAQVYSGNAVILFADESETYVLALDMYYGKDERWLPAGTYPIGKTNGAEGTVDLSAEYTQFILPKEDDRKIAISGGNVTVTLDEEKKYHFTVELVTEEGPLKAVFNGDINGYNFSYDFTATSARRIYPDEVAPGEFLIKLNDEDWNFELTLDLFSSNTGATQLPAGTYTVGDGSVGSGSYMEIMKPYYEKETFASGTVEVKKDGNVYTIGVSLTDADGFKITGTFSGEVGYMGEPAGEIVMQSASAALGGGLGTLPREAAIRFFRDDDILELAVLYDQKAKYLPAGKYTVGSGETPGTIDNSNSDYTYLWYKENLYDIKSGSMNVDIVGDEYDITMQLSTSGGYYKIRYKGKIDGINFFFDLSSMSEARRLKPENEADGQYRIKLINAPVRTQELILDFFADPESDTLPEGTYTVGTDNKAGTLGPESVFTVTSPNKTSDSFASGSVKVSKKDDDTYTLDIRVANADGYEFIGTYTGNILDMVREDDEDPADRTVFTFTRYKKGVCKDQKNACFLLINDDNSILGVNSFTDGSSFLPAGTYTVGEGTDAGTVQLCNFSYLSYYVNGKSTKHLMTEGVMTVKVEGDIYTIIFDFTADDVKYRAKYKGEFITF